MHLAGDQRHPALGPVDAERHARPAPSTTGRKPSRSSRCAAGSTMPRTSAEQRQPQRPGRPRPRGTPAAAARPRRPGRRRSTGGDHLARVDRQLEGGQEQVVLGAEVVVHQRRVDPGGRGDRADRRTGEALGGEQRRAPRRGSRPGCRATRAATAARARRTSRLSQRRPDREVLAGELQRLAQVASRSSRVARTCGC